MELPGNSIKLITHHSKGLNEDLLHYGDYARVLADTVDNLTFENTGLTIGVFGDWGSGKSTILRMICELLKPTKGLFVFKKRLVIEFDAWRYADQQNLWVAFLQKILKGIESELGPVMTTFINVKMWYSSLDTKKIVNSIISFLVRLIIAIILIILSVEFISLSIHPILRTDWLPVLTWLKDALEVATIPAVIWFLFSESIKQIIGGFKQLFTFKLSLAPNFFKPLLDYSSLSSADQFQRDLISIVNTVGRSNPIVVLIDDLDRAPVDQIVPILESIKHFSSVSSEKNRLNENSYITFILAADRRTIERAIASHYDKFWTQLDQPEIKDRYAREYFEKIVQIFFEIPPLSPTQLNELLSEDQEAEIGTVQWARQQARQVLTQVPKQNPREVIQAYNSFQYLWKIIQDRKIPNANAIWFPQILATLTIIKYIWPSVFEKIARWPELFFDLHGVACGNENQGCKKSEIEEILSMGCPSGGKDSMVDTIRHNYPDLLKLLGVVDIKDVSLDSLFGIITLSGDQKAPKGWHLIEVGDALMSGDPTLIKFAMRTNSGEVMKDRVIWLMEFFQEKTLVTDGANGKKVEDLGLENKMIRAIFAIGRLNDPRALEPLKKVIVTRENHSDAVIARVVFSLAHLEKEER